jgi:hypothetical protein
MTERKPEGMTWESWVERKIREAQEEGEFDNLPGMGKPIPDLGKPLDELWWVKDKLKREQLSHTPPTLALRKEVEEARAAIDRAGSEAEVRRIVAAINERIVKVNKTGGSGPPSDFVPLDADTVVARWREKSSGA